MPHISWSRRASSDLLRLYNFLAEKSYEAAFRAQELIRSEINILGNHPSVGRLIDELPTEYRELVVPFGQGAYVIRYRYGGTEVVILAIRHSRELDY